MLFTIFSAVLGIATVASGSPAVPHCSTFLWNTVGNHGLSPCINLGENQILSQLENIKDYYSKLLLQLPSDDIFGNPHIKELVSEIKSLVNYEEDEKGDIICTACKSVVELTRYYITEGKSNDELNGIIEQLCATFKIQTPPVCTGIAQLFGPIIIHIMNTSSVETLDICTFLVSECGDINLPVWEIQLPPSPPPTEQPLPPRDGSVLKVLHIADTHYDRFYTEGAKVYCDEPLCCRSENGMAEPGEKAAGKWGDWRCDTPERTLDSMLEHAANNYPDIDYIVWTGDLPAHDIWKQSPEDNLKVLNISVSKIKSSFPNIPVFPAVGNHESAPVNNFPDPVVDNWPISWLYDELQKEWSTWLPEETSSTIKKGAYYTTLARPGLRIVSLNTNYCYGDNWWLVINSTDPAQQLQWFVDVLKKAEDENEKVHIVAHIPPGQNDCVDVWKDNYYNIVTRFENTIASQFFGHTHKDEFEIYYDVKNDTRAVGVGYIGPAVTTYTSLNPGYRVYYVDGDHDDTTRMVIDHDNWVLDLEQSNSLDKPVWYKSYSAKQEYGLENLIPQEWHKFYENLKTDNELFQLYYRHYYKDSPERGQCDDSCKRGRLCAIRSCRKYGEPTL